jgi:MOSC domain-containing protein YiiM
MINMEGKVLSVCISSEKGTKKREVNSASLIPDWGIEGDAHAGRWHRQVSLLSVEEINKMKRRIPDLMPGDFAENITTQGIDLDHIKIGDRIIVGEDIVLEVSQIGKECHSGCEIQKLTGECIMPKKGVFAKVLEGGVVKKDDSLEFKR